MDFHHLPPADLPGAPRLNGWPIRSPTDASPTSSRTPAHGSGATWIATPSSQWTFTTYSLPVSRRTHVCYGPNGQDGTINFSIPPMEVHQIHVQQYSTFTSACGTIVP